MDIKKNNFHDFDCFLMIFGDFQHLSTTTTIRSSIKGDQNKEIKNLLVRAYVNYFFFFPKILFFIMIGSADLDNWPDSQSLAPKKKGVYLKKPV